MSQNSRKSGSSSTNNNNNIPLQTSSLLPSMHAQSLQHLEQQRARQRHNVHVLFLEDRKDDHVLNRLTAMLGRRVHNGQGFCHVEIVIPDEEHAGDYLSSSIYNGETVTLTRTKTFANPGYTVLTFTVDGAELARMADYLHESKRMQLGFDSVGMYLAALPFQLNPFAPASKTFCSKHVTTALKAAKIEAVEGLNENIVTPSKLYRVLHDKLRKDRLVVGSVQYKQRALAESGAVFTIQ